MKITILQLRSFYIEKKRSLGYTVTLDGIMTDQGRKMSGNDLQDQIRREQQQ